MEAVFRTVLNMSVTASWVILAVLFVRLLLRRAPKKYSYLLWSVVGFRLACPVSFRSAFSLFGLELFSGKSSGGTLSYVPEYVGAGTDYGQLVNGMKAPAPLSTGAATLDSAVQEMAPVGMKYSLDWFTVLSWVWCLGAAAMLLYAVASYLRLRRSLNQAVRGEDAVWYAENLRSPFILGFVRPRIYLPFGLDAAAESYVLAHERCHLKRGDHWVKPLAFLLLSLHWFNPLCHLAFYLMGLDMEMSCDEHVLRGQEGISKAYSTTLLSFAANRRFPAPSPLAFAESGAGKRIKNALRWKRPKLWLSGLAAVLCLVAVIGCAADPVEKPLAELGELSKAEITLNPPGSSATVTAEAELRELAQLLRELEVRGAGPELNGQYVSFTLEQEDGGTLSVAVCSPCLVIDGVAYEADSSGCEALESFGKGFFQALPDKGTPPGEAASSGEAVPVDEEAPAAEETALQALVDQALRENLPDGSDGLCHTVSYVILDTAAKDASGVEVYAMVMYQNFDLSGGQLRRDSGRYGTAVLRFGVDGEGRYSLDEYLQRDSAGALMELFPDAGQQELEATELSYLPLMQDCYAQAVASGQVDTAAVCEALFTEIAAEPAWSSNSGDYIDARLRELLYYGDYTLTYIYDRFLAGGETGLEGQLMRLVMDELLDGWVLRLYAETGQDYFDALLESAGEMEAEMGESAMKESAPQLWLLLRRAEESGLHFRF